MSTLDEKISEFKKETLSVIEKRKEAEKAYHDAFDEHVKYVDKSINIDWQISQLGFFKRKEKEFLLEEKRKNEIKKEKANKKRIRTYNDFKKVDEQFNDLKNRFYKFCNENGIETPEEEESEFEE